MNVPTDRLPSLEFDCCLIIRWRADHPERQLPDLPRAYAERLLEDMLTSLQPYLRELQVVEQLPSGELGGVLRSWTAAPTTQPPSPDNAPAHSPTWFVATARSFNPSSTQEGE
ncbi:MAG: hypothetical protein WC326_02030 [Candidatus Delongbacteria bacterium]